MKTMILTLLLVSATAAAAPAEPLGLYDEHGTPIPMIDARTTVHVTGEVATAIVEHTYRNGAQPLASARFVFPLPHDAAVYAMTLTIGDRVTRAEIKRKADAEQTFEAAAKAGHTAALLTEHRANVFSESIANVPAGEAVRVKLEYAHAVAREDGRYVLHVPSGVGPRYENGTHGAPSAGITAAIPSGDAVAQGAIRVVLDTGLTPSAVESASHYIDVREAAPLQVFALAPKAGQPGDFELAYRVDAPTLGAALVERKDPRGRFFSLLVEPPVKAQPTVLRELVFVIDASCSMEGAPLQASKALVRAALDTLSAEDHFRVIVFGSDTGALDDEALAATPANLQNAARFIDALGTRGGTEIELGIRRALSAPADGSRRRYVVFLTDGLIGDELSVIATVRKYLGAARIMSFGVGRTTNRWLIEELAIAGRGVSRVIAPDEDPMPAVRELAARLRGAHVEDAWVDFGDCAATAFSPANTFDIFPGAPIRLRGRLPAEGCSGPLELVGTRGGKVERWPLRVVHVAEGSADAEALPVLWARAQVGEKMRTLAVTRQDAENGALVEEVTRLGLEFRIATRFTSFVAVAPTAQPMVAQAVAAQSAGFQGSSTPEPATWAAMGLIGALAARMRRRRRNH